MDKQSEAEIFKTAESIAVSTYLNIFQSTRYVRVMIKAGFDLNDIPTGTIEEIEHYWSAALFMAEGKLNHVG